MTAWLAPILCFTAEEAWLQRNPGDNQSVHLRTFPEIREHGTTKTLGAKWEKIREIRRVVLGSLEIERAEKRIGSSSQAAPAVFVSPEMPRRSKARSGGGRDHLGRVIETGTPPANAFTLPDVARFGVVPTKADGHKCERCWKVLPDVGKDEEFRDICPRCADAVRGLQEVAAERRRQAVMMRIGLFAGGIVLILDHLTKWLIRDVVLDGARYIEITGFFNLVEVWNRGVSFGLFASSSPWTPVLLSALAIGIATVLILVWMRKAETRCSPLPLAS